MDTCKAFGGEHIFPPEENKKQTFLSVSGNIPGGEIVTPDKAGSLGFYMLEEKINEHVTSNKHNHLKS